MAGSCRNRIVVLIDMDCFFCQVETKLQPEYEGKPLAVVQYSQWEFGGIIAVNYEAREYGVTRHMRADEAKEKCPGLLLATVPCLRGKADTSRYRAAGREVIEVIRKHCTVIERASVDEAYLDITDIVDKKMSAELLTPSQIMSQLLNTFIVGYSEIGKNDEEDRRKGMETWISNIFDELDDPQAQKLAVAAMIVEELRADIYETTGYRCSAGIAENKILAKLACGLHKPNRQTILPPSAVSSLYSTLPVKKVRNLGGKFGDVVVESLNCNVMGDLLQYSLQYLQKRFDEKTGLWLYNIARGIDNEPVTTRLVSKSIGACKKFPGKQAIVSLEVLKHWTGELSAEVCERLEQDLEENERRATLLTVCYHYYQNRTTVSQSRSCNLNSYNPEKMAKRCVDIITKSTQCPVAYVGISVGKFIPAKGAGNFINFFKSNKSEESQNVDSKLKDTQEVINVPDSIKTLETNDSNTDSISNDNHKNNELREMDDIPASTSKEKKLAVRPNSQKLTEGKSVKTDTCITADSPTSRKVNNLIQSLNERTSKTTLYKNMINKDLNESVDQEKFKGSFFMNIFNTKEIKPANEICGKDKHINVEEASDIDGCDLEQNCVKNICDSARNEKLAVSESTEKLDNNTDTGEKSNQDIAVRLQEIFPDLNNIDASVVALLPIDLQEEARSYMKVQNKSNTKVAETVGKNSKSKSSKSKINSAKNSTKNSAKKKNNTNMESFLVKQNCRDVQFERCTECQQMISVLKMEEHRDFHVAQNLQRELNLVNDTERTGVKRKSTDSEEATSKRRSLTDVVNKNCQRITAFLS